MDHDADLKVWTALQEERPHLDEYETWALIRLTSLIGPMRCVDIPRIARGTRHRRRPSGLLHVDPGRLRGGRGGPRGGCVVELWLGVVHGRFIPTKCPIC